MSKYTPYSGLTDEELLRFGMSKTEIPTPLEMELLQRLEMRIDEEQSCATLERATGCKIKVEGEV